MISELAPPILGQYIYSISHDKVEQKHNLTWVPILFALERRKLGLETGWLSECLQRHPGLWNPGHKEFHFFDRAEMSTELNQLAATPRKVVLRKLENSSLDINPSLQESILKSKIITFEQYTDLFGNAPSSKKTWEITPR